MPKASKKQTVASKSKSKRRSTKAKSHVATRAKQPVRRGLLARILSFPQAEHWFVVSALVTLLVSTTIWSLLAALLHRSNSDQIVNTYLFERWQVFRGAFFPGAHTQLLKWPLFYVMQLFGASTTIFVVATVLMSLLTVGGLAFILYKIDRRPAVFGSLLFCLASVLWLVPTQPYAGAILPVNMAMIATRNLEYIVFIGSLIFLLRPANNPRRTFWAGVISLGLLIASDKLFAVLGLGAIVITGVLNIAVRQKVSFQLIRRLALGGLVALLLGFGVLGVINHAHLTHIVNETNASPYSVHPQAKNVVLGSLYAVMGVLTNFGANPAFDANQVKAILPTAAHRLAGVASFSYLVNGFVLIAGLIVVLKLFKRYFTQPSKTRQHLTTSQLLAVLLIWSSFIAVAAFVFSQHYFAVDARYLAITVFAVFIAAAAHVRSTAGIPLRMAIIIGVIAVLSITAGSVVVVTAYRDSNQALSEVNHRNQLVAQTVTGHTVDVLVGDYWRVLPIKEMMPISLNVMPLQTCTTSRIGLSSQAWQPDLRNRSFAYLLTLDRSLTDFPSCTLDQVIKLYGRPNGSSLIAGTLDQPKELVLFYDRGSHTSLPTNPTQTTKLSTIFPTALEQIPNTRCRSGQTTMQIVAHQDDDLLFMSPDLLHTLHASGCIVTVYLTAGDAGAGKLYWLSRERGSEAAYLNMLQIKSIWITRPVQLADKQFVTVASPRDDSQVTLIFMRLPDGDIHGEGFPAFQWQSLARVRSGNLGELNSVDGQSTFLANDIVAALTHIMRVYQPTQVRTQTPYNASNVFPDHSDHIMTGQFSTDAFEAYAQSSASITYYLGYPTHALAPNIEGLDLDLKESTFLTYAQFDPHVCQTVLNCESTATYNSYLRRQYTTGASDRD